MGSATATGVTTTQVYEIYIKATPDAIWHAITAPDWTERYGYKGAIEMELRPGGSYRALANPGMKAMGMPDVVIDGVVEESDPPRRLVHTYRFLFSDVMKDEGFTRLTWEIEQVSDSCRLTVTHDQLRDGACEELVVERLAGEHARLRLASEGDGELGRSARRSRELGC